MDSSGIKSIDSLSTEDVGLRFARTGWKSFERLIQSETAILHGSITGRDQHIELATKAREICGRIVEAAVKIQN